MRNRHTINQALDRALLLGRLYTTNALIQNGPNELWLICAVREGNLWLDFDACCTGDHNQIVWQEQEKCLKCTYCDKHAHIDARLTPAVMSAFFTDAVEGEYKESPVGEWVKLNLPKYGKHPLWSAEVRFPCNVPFPS